MKVYSLVNQKGGVSKSTTAAELWAGLNARGYKCLAIDLDPQRNLSYHAGARTDGKSSFGLLTREATAAEAIQHTKTGDFIAASQALAGANKSIDETGKEYRLKEALSPLGGLYDYIVIDTPPTLGILTVNALTASDSLIIPALADVYSLQGIEELSHTISAVKTYCNKDLLISGILLTKYNPRTLLSQSMGDTMQGLAQKLGTRVFDTTIREGIAVREAQLKQMSLRDYAPNAKVTQDYDAFVDELLTTERGKAL